MICSELNRVLSHSGKLVITMDISLDGSRDISKDRALELLAMLDSYFEYQPQSEHASSADHLRADLKRDDVFTSHDALVLDPSLLPWHYPGWIYRLQALLRGKGIVPWPPLLTVFCATYVKR